MTYITDHKQRPYKLMGVNDKYTVLECVETGATLILASDMFNQMGFTS